MRDDGEPHSELRRSYDMTSVLRGRETAGCRQGSLSVGLCIRAPRAAFLLVLLPSHVASDIQQIALLLPQLPFSLLAANTFRRRDGLRPERPWWCRSE